MQKMQPGMTPEREVYLYGCRTFQQYCKTRRIYEIGHCDFCNWETNWKPQDIFFQSPFVVGGVNQYKKTEHEHHLLVLPTRSHVTALADFSDREWVHVLHALVEAEKRFQIKGGGLVARIGDPRYHCGTIEHWHANFIVPDLASGKEVRPPLAKTPAELAEDKARAARFAFHYEALERSGMLQGYLNGKNWSPPAPPPDWTA